jgi:hypothetical protein
MKLQILVLVTKFEFMTIELKGLKKASVDLYLLPQKMLQTKSVKLSDTILHVFL